MAVILPPLTNFPNSFTDGKSTKFPTKPYNITHYSRRVLPPYLGKSNVQIYCKLQKIKLEIESYLTKK